MIGVQAQIQGRGIDQARSWAKCGFISAKRELCPNVTKSNFSIVLILGSGPDATRCRDWPRAPFTDIVAINNAWRVRADWTHLLCPDDFAQNRRPQTLSQGQAILTSDSYVPAQNRFGGVVYAGGTMAFTAGYWALATLRPMVLAFWGCDMIYPNEGPTHFYGSGQADPLRRDVTLRSLEAKSARLWLQAARVGCQVVNLSNGPSRLLFPSAMQADLPDLAARNEDFDLSALVEAEAEESRLGYIEPSGRYWERAAAFDVTRIDAIDALWLQAFRRVHGNLAMGSGLHALP